MKNKYRYNILTLIAATIICLVVIHLHLLSYNKTKDIFLEQTEKIAIDMKKEFLKDTIDNVFIEIDMLREAKYQSYKRNIEVRQRRFEEEIDLSDEDFIEFYIDKFNEDTNSSLWTSFLWDKHTGEILYDPSKLYSDNIDSTLENLKSLMSSYVIIEKGSIEGIFGVSKSYIDGIVKTEIADDISRRRFSNDSYIWVNEVVSYQGGEDYAVRLIHPNQPETEGMFLSTDMEDIRGNKPYLDELEGINKYGEVFFDYYFKELNSDVISEKITYAKLYEDYDWIIAMGVHLNDIDAYAEEMNSEIISLSSKSVINVLAYILIVLLIGFLLIYLIGRRRLLNSTKFLEKEINLDVLTGAYSRRYGEKLLYNLYKQYTQTGDNPAIMMFDIDNFKNLNDTYGHDVGDAVLIETVNIIKNVIRTSDQLIRWGGDEFVGVFPGLKIGHVLEYGQKLLDKLSSLEIPVMDGNIYITISVGFSYFKDTDNDCSDVIKRADVALYKSKERGKNEVNLLL